MMGCDSKAAVITDCNFTKKNICCKLFPINLLEDTTNETLNNAKLHRILSAKLYMNPLKFHLLCLWYECIDII